MAGDKALRLRLRLKRGDNLVLGPGRAQLLDAIDATGSISAAARSMGMSYRRAWLLVDDTNRAFRTSLVESVAGGQRGGGAHLTETGRRVLAAYRELVEAAATAGRDALDALEELLADTPQEEDQDQQAR